MKKRLVSSKDVADLAGVSRTTVSFVLNGASGKIIPEETRQRVLEAARSLHYVPDDTARQVAKTVYLRIGFLVNHTHSVYSDAYILRMLEGMGPVLNKRRCSLVLLPMSEAHEDALSLVRSMHLDGVIMTNNVYGNLNLNPLIQAGVPLVFIGTTGADEIDQIDVDNLSAAYEVTKHIISNGHQRIAMIAHAPMEWVAAEERYKGYCAALKEFGIEYKDELVRWANLDENSGRAAMESLLSLRERPTAVFAGNDAIAYGAIETIRAHGLSIPADISIVGFDDDYPSRFMPPPLTSMTLPASSIGERAATMVLDRIMHPELPTNRIILPVKLTVRESCGQLAPTRKELDKDPV